MIAFKLLISLLTLPNVPRLDTSWCLWALEVNTSESLMIETWVKIAPLGECQSELLKSPDKSKNEWETTKEKPNSKHDSETLDLLDFGVIVSNSVLFAHHEVLLFGHGCCCYIQRDLPAPKTFIIGSFFYIGEMCAALACVDEIVWGSRDFSPLLGFCLSGWCLDSPLTVHWTHGSNPKKEQRDLYVCFAWLILKLLISHSALSDGPCFLYILPPVGWCCSEFDEDELPFQELRKLSWKSEEGP